MKKIPAGPIWGGFQSIPGLSSGGSMGGEARLWSHHTPVVAVDEMAIARAQGAFHSPHIRTTTLAGIKTESLKGCQ